MRSFHLCIVALVLSCSSDKSLAIRNVRPTVVIHSPPNGSDHLTGETIEFVAQIGDDQDPAVTLIRAWSSDVEGGFTDTSVVDASGSVLWSTSQLELGAHTITLQVVDSEGLSASHSINVEIVVPEEEEEEEEEEEVDLDNDGFTVEEGDCDDTDADIHPFAEDFPYDGIDQDCDGEDLTDQDGDGHDAIVAGGDDCNDFDESSHPGASEICDGEDTDCDGTVDEEDADYCDSWWLDADDDDFGAEGAEKCLCGPSGDYTADNDDDCADDNAEANPDFSGWATTAMGDGSWDWDCNGTDEVESTDLGSCGDWPSCGGTTGWRDGIPACGETAAWQFDCSLDTFSCRDVSEALVMGCR
jgi:hypothetical protein